jgi:hypothetical protein
MLAASQESLTASEVTWTGTYLPFQQVTHSPQIAERQQTLDTMDLDYSANIYLAITTAASSLYARDPSSIQKAYPALTYVKQVGQLDDSHIYSVPKTEGEGESMVLEKARKLLKKSDGLIRVELQTPKQRYKRGEL